MGEGMVAGRGFEPRSRGFSWVAAPTPLPPEGWCKERVPGFSVFPLLTLPGLRALVVVLGRGR